MGNQNVSSVKEEPESTAIYPPRYHGVQLLRFIAKNVILEERVIHSMAIKEIRNSYRPEYLPPTLAGYEHPTNWLWHHEAWDCYVDENGYMYYFNNQTGESTWDPPPELQQLYALDTYLPPGGAEPLAEIDGTAMETPAPETVTQVSTNNGRSKRLIWDESSNAIVDGSGLTKSVLDRLDISNAFIAFASKTQSSSELLEDRNQESEAVLQQLSEGVFSKDNLIMVSWAYKFHLFRGTYCFYRYFSAS